MKDNRAVSRSQEDYLESILTLLNKKTVVRVTDLAQEMKLSKPSINKAIKNLKSQGLVDHEHYGSITLTIKGECLAKNVQMRHQILKKFLKAIGVNEEKAEEEACAIEHSISIDTIEKLNNFLNEHISPPPV